MSLPADQMEEEKKRIGGKTRALNGTAAQTYPMEGEGSQSGPGLQLSDPQQSLPASPSGGIANGERTPVSPQANESQGGAGNSDIDLVKDRGKPPEYIQNTMIQLGSDKTLDIAEKSAAKSNHTSGAMGEDPEMAKLQGGRMADEIKITDNKKGQANRAGLENMFGKYMDNVVKVEVDTNKITEKEAMIKSKKYKGIFAGMTREEFSMFLFDFGGSLMSNGEQGLGAVGVASGAAMAGHRGRQKEGEASALAATELTRTTDLEEREMANKEQTAGMAGIAQGFTNPDGFFMVPSFDPETGKTTWNPAEDRDGNPQKGDPRASKDYNGEKVFLDGFLTEAGWSKQEIADFFGKAKGTQARRQDLTDALMARISGAGILDKDPITGKKLRDFKEGDIKSWVDKMLAIEKPEDSSLPPGSDAGSAALTDANAALTVAQAQAKYGPKSTD